MAQITDTGTTPYSTNSTGLVGKNPAEGNENLGKAFNTAINEAQKTMEITTLGGIFLHCYKQQVR